MTPAKSPPESALSTLALAYQLREIAGETLLGFTLSATHVECIWALYHSTEEKIRVDIHLTSLGLFVYHEVYPHVYLMGEPYWYAGKEPDGLRIHSGLSSSSL